MNLLPVIVGLIVSIAAATSLLLTSRTTTLNSTSAESAPLRWTNFSSPAGTSKLISVRTVRSPPLKFVMSKYSGSGFSLISNE